MKALKCFAVCAVFFVTGACSVAPDPTAFLDTVKGKTLVVKFPAITAHLKASADGKKLTDQVDNAYFEFSAMDSDSAAIYNYYLKDGTRTETYDMKAILNSAKTGGTIHLKVNGSFPNTGTLITFTIQ